MRKGLLALLIVMFLLSSCNKPMSRLSTGDNVYVPDLHKELPKI